VLEAHAVARAAANPNRDLRDACASLDLAFTSRRDVGWARREVAFHRALNDQGGNAVPSSLAERTLRDALSACPIPSGDVLEMLQAQHRVILRCVEAVAVDDAARGTGRPGVRLRT
jgi:DNA-binding GntR family transcriptional regulator